MLTLRPYQTELIEQARASLRGGCKRLLLQCPTGGGKTVLIAQMLATAAAKGKRAWFCVHRRELLDQAVRTFVESADIRTGIIAAGYRPDQTAPVQVCSVNSLSRRMAKLEKPDLLVWDECHHVPSATWAAIARAVPQAHQLGLTATPQRLDGKGLRPYFDALLLGPTVAELIEQGHLSDYRLFAPGVLDTSTFHKVAGDFDKAEVATAMAASTVVGDAVKTYQQHAAGGRALVFVWSIAASEAIAQAFNDAGIPAAHVDGETPKDERKRALASFRAGALRVLCNVDLFGEGLDVPAVDAVFLLRPTSSLGLYLQQCGRGLRPAPGKTHVRIFDHVGNWTRHGLPDEARAWSLDGKVKKPKEETSKRCEHCLAVSPSTAMVCVACGRPFPGGEPGSSPRQIAQVEGELVEADLTKLRTGAMRAAREATSLAELQDIARRCGYKPGWAWWQWQWKVQRGSHVHK